MINNNEAIFARLTNILPIDGADNIVTAEVTVNKIKITNVIVGKGTPEGTKIVYFDSNMVLSEEFLKENESSRRYISKTNRIKVVKLRGAISNGLALEYETFFKWDPKLKFVEGESFLKIKDTEICHRYVPTEKGQPGMPGSKKNKKPISRIVPGQFNFHIDTKKYFTSSNSVKPTDLISISRKLHGTSFIVSNCLVKKQLSFKDKVAKFLGINVVETEYGAIASSRKITRGSNFGSKEIVGDIWVDIKNELSPKMFPGETIYGEAVGYLSTGKAIQKDYDYSAHANTYDKYIYRITNTDANGHVTELDWLNIKARCEELGEKMVPEFYFGIADDFIGKEKSLSQQSFTEGFSEKIRDVFLEKMCTDCKSKKTPEEGVVIRVEGRHLNVSKAKSDLFFLKESKANETTDDIEEMN